MYEKFYLKTKLKKNPTDNDGWTPLHHASWNDKFEVCQRLRDSLSQPRPCVLAIHVYYTFAVEPFPS